MISPPNRTSNYNHFVIIQSNNSPYITSLTCNPYTHVILYPDFYTVAFTLTCSCSNIVFLIILTVTYYSI